MFITRLKPASGKQFVFTDANSKAPVHHWTLKHSWWWANQPYSVQQELEERLLEFSEVTLEVLENHLCQRVQIAAAKNDGFVCIEIPGVPADRSQQVAFGFCNLVTGAYRFYFR